MKRLLILILAFTMLSGAALAEQADYASMGTDELVSVREGLLETLGTVNAELGRRARDEATAVTDGDSLGKIRELFPDEVIACYVRDRLNKFSIEQTVTQAELDTITILGPKRDYGSVYDLTGVSHLRHLKVITFYTNNGWCARYYGTELPDELYTLTELEQLSIAATSSINLESISDKIGNLTKLKYLHLEHTKITSLPDTLCQLTQLESLIVNDTNLESLPENIGNLKNLKRLNISNTKITSLPDSIWNLSLDSLDMSGTGIK